MDGLLGGRGREGEPVREEKLTPTDSITLIGQ